MSHIRIKSGGKFTNTSIEVDGKRIERATAVEFGVNSDEGVWVRITIAPSSIEIDADAQVEWEVAD